MIGEDEGGEIAVVDSMVRRGESMVEVGDFQRVDGE